MFLKLTSRRDKVNLKKKRSHHNKNHQSQSKMWRISQNLRTQAKLLVTRKNELKVKLDSSHKTTLER